MLYLDTSVFVPIFAREARSQDVVNLVAAWPDPILISPWVLAETQSALSLKVRTGALTSSDANAARVRVAQVASAYQVEPVIGADFEKAAEFLSTLASPLRAADALHIALCERISAELLTLDVEMATAAKEIGLRVEKV